MCVWCTRGWFFHTDTSVKIRSAFSASKVVRIVCFKRSVTNESIFTRKRTNEHVT